MQKIIRFTATALGTAVMCIMGLVGFYSSQLPDFYYVPSGEELSVNTAFTISSKPADTKIQAVNTSEENDVKKLNSQSKIGGSTLMLFDSIPIKEVKTQEVERPMLVPCGQPFGIKLMTDGVMVVRLEELEGECPATSCGIQVGDIITSVNGESVSTNKKIGELIADSEGNPCEIEYKHGGELKCATLTPIYSEGSYKAGMWVRDSSAGIGTLTFYNPSDGTFGGLGHPICDADTNQPLPLSHGTVGDVKITGNTVSIKGAPGQLLGEFTSSASIGDILSNSDSGVFGTLNVCPSESEAIPLGFSQEVHVGKATIYTTIEGNEPKEYEISIEKVDLSDNATHDLIVKITDEELLEKTGGIVQGMSGSPIIQDGKLVGAVTHVFVDDPTEGYGIFAEEMYDNAQCTMHNAQLVG